jgi:hypothetical protein
MSIIEEFKRMKTIEFWMQVKYCSVLKWPLPKKQDLLKKTNGYLL